MCFLLPQRKGERYAKLAKRNIPCWKKIKVSKKGVYVSVHFAFVYEDAYEYENDNFSRDGARYPGGEGKGEGLHSFSKLPYNTNFFGYRIIKCYIPKGSYYFHYRNAYFSNRLVVVGLEK